MHQSVSTWAVALLIGVILAAGCAASPSAAPTPAGAYSIPTLTGVHAAPSAPTPTASPPTAPAPILRARVVERYRHDPLAFTQGLVYLDDASFYEGTGLYGASSLRKVALAGAPIIARFDLEPDYFGEGVAVVGDRIFQLTWQNGVGFIYTYAEGAFTRIATFRYPPPGRSLPREGWGLTFDGARLVMSDGTATLYFVDPAATERTGILAVSGQVEVRDHRGPVTRLNELEYVNGAIFANIWQSDLIAHIDPATGRVLAYIDLRDLRALLDPAEYGPSPPEALNGIAYDAANSRLLVTGKFWPRLFAIEIIDPNARNVYVPLAYGAIPSP